MVQKKASSVLFCFKRCFYSEPDIVCFLGADFWHFSAENGHISPIYSCSPAWNILFLLRHVAYHTSLPLWMNICKQLGIHCKYHTDSQARDMCVLDQGMITWLTTFDTKELAILQSWSLVGPQSQKPSKMTEALGWLGLVMFKGIKGSMVSEDTCCCYILFNNK